LLLKSAVNTILNPDYSNTIFQKAIAFAMNTNCHLFITGKAGTGKTTFLKYLKEKTTRKIAIVAPTGVAAINAGGVTIHSFFQLPFGVFLPGHQTSWNYAGEVNNAKTLIANQSINPEKLEIIRALEVLVIDEVSMVRADLMDALDTVLRHVKSQPHLPFGGIQLILIGDLYQLPPVVKNAEWDLLRQYYKSPFFFDAQALQQKPPIYIELKKIYRQKDDRFISLLNSVRNNCCTQEDLELLHQYYKPGFTPPEGEHYITLSSHNEKADKINQRELDKLPGETHSFDAKIEGAFYENSYPAEKTLFLKAGAQIMFIKNDTGESRRFYNGKIGTIRSIEGEKIFVSFPDEQTPLELEQETWENVKYDYNKDTDKIESNKQGTFRQYPIRLAWAITIHKSQGLTFDRAIIDAGASFAAGQVYVSLSRLTSMDGLVLYSRILPGCISTDPRVVEYSKKEISEQQLDRILDVEQRNFIRHSLMIHFDFSNVCELLKDNLQDYEFRQMNDKPSAIRWAADLLNVATSEQAVAAKFVRQLQQIISTEPNNHTLLYQRIIAGVVYFKSFIDQKIIASLNHHIEDVKGQSRIRNYVTSLREIIRTLERKKLYFDNTLVLIKALEDGQSIDELLLLLEKLRKPVYIPLQGDSPKPKKRTKGDSMRESLQMFRAGKSIQDIARERLLGKSTIFSHLIDFISTGEVDVKDLVSPEKLESILKAIDENPDQPSSFYKERLGDNYEFSEIRAVMAFKQLLV
jgi:hypothetical protein